MFEPAQLVFIDKVWIPQTRESGEWQYFVEVDRKLTSGATCTDTEYVTTSYEQAYQRGSKLAQQYGCAYNIGQS